MNKFSRKALAVLLSAVVFTGIICGCSKNNAAKSTVTVGITQEPSVLDPHTVNAAGDREIIFNIYEGLYKFDSEGALNPCLATGYELSPEMDEYIFTIRKGVKFHNGKEMTPEDVVFSISRAAGLLSGQEQAPVDALKVVSEVSVSKDDASKVIVKLKEKSSELLSYFTVGIIPSGYEDCQTKPIGTGPFKFDSYNPGQNVTISRFDGYWGTKASIDTAVFKICADIDAGMVELTNGSIDIFPHFTTDRAKQIDQTKFRVDSNVSNMPQIFILNNKVAPFDNPKVREALNYAINRKDVISVSTDGNGVVLTTAMSPAMGKYYDTSLDSTYTYDAEKAKKLLEEAGFPDGFESTVTVCSSYLLHVNAAVEIAAELKKIGVNLKINQVDWATWLDQVYSNRKYDTTVICVDSAFAPYDVLARYASDSSKNFFNYSNARVDELLKLIPMEKDEAKKVEYYHEILSCMVKDNNNVYIQDPTSITIVSNRIDGYKTWPMYVVDLSTVKVVK
ncbi:MAG: ABC transporter substrate-binding protein [Ruminococcaceae bacterium]|nr:ABC transporter substrate-binding protein [Oscillospiraceae bacterium]